MPHQKGLEKSHFQVIFRILSECWNNLDLLFAWISGTCFVWIFLLIKSQERDRIYNGCLNLKKNLRN